MSNNCAKRLFLFHACSSLSVVLLPQALSALNIASSIESLLATAAACNVALFLAIDMLCSSRSLKLPQANPMVRHVKPNVGVIVQQTFVSLAARSMFRTASWSVWIASLLVVPLVSKIGLQCSEWRRVFFERKLADLEEMGLFGAMIGGLAGSWAACIVIPLDWNRPWQYWPVPNSIGTVIGSIAGLLIGMLAAYCPVCSVSAERPRPHSTMVIDLPKTPIQKPKAEAAASQTKRTKSPTKARRPQTTLKSKQSRARSTSPTKKSGRKPAAKKLSPARRASSRVATPRK